MTHGRRRSDSPRSGPRVPTHHAASPGAQVTIRVIKVGGRAQGDPRLFDAVATAAKTARVVLVHGGGDEISAFQRRLGVEPAFVGGRRVTTADDLEIVRMVLSGTVNKRLVSQLASAGVQAVGVSGEDGRLLAAKAAGEEMGRVGRDVLADVSLLAHLLNGGWVPVISPLAREQDGPSAGAGLNVNGDDAAATIAAGLGADELVFVADVPGVLENGTLVPDLDLAGARSLAERGVAQGGMRAKLEAATLALRNGVRRVRIAGLEGITDRTAGTLITQPPITASPA